MNRTKERKIVFEIVFSFPFNNGSTPDELIERYFSSNDNLTKSDYIVDTVKGIYENLDEIDYKIKKCIKTRAFERLDNICIAAMRLGTYEALFNDDIPVNVAINEAIELTKEYDDSLSAFVHANLGTIIK